MIRDAVAGEFAMTVLTSIAQQESESISTNVKMGLKMKMRRGELIGFQGCVLLCSSIYYI